MARSKLLSRTKQIAFASVSVASNLLAEREKRPFGVGQCEEGQAIVSNKKAPLPAIAREGGGGSPIKTRVPFTVTPGSVSPKFFGFFLV